MDERQALRSPFGESSAGSNAHGRSFQLGANLAQGAAKKKKIIEELFGGQKLALDTQERAAGSTERGVLETKPPFDRLRTVRRGARLVFVFELGFYFRFGVFVDDYFVGLELVGVAG